jgi:hypothetical protein
VTPVVELYGWSVWTELQLLGATQPAGPLREPDVTLRLAEHRDVPVTLPEGDVLALWGTPERFAHAVVRLGPEVTFRIPGIADFLIVESDPGFAVTCSPAASDQLGLTQVLASGALFAVLFELSGQPILHASAVAVGDRAVAVVGHSGRGKTTTGALLVRGGYELVTDDLLRLELGTSEVTCFRGTTGLRLRESTRAWVENSKAEFEMSPDARLVVTAPPSTRACLPLGALLFPVPMKDGSTAVTSRRLSTAETLDELLASPRFYGWEDPTILTNLFRLAADLAVRLPAFEVRIPWTESFDDDLVRELTSTVASFFGDTAEPVDR